jgi:hypothetical protein
MNRARWRLVLLLFLAVGVSFGARQILEPLVVVPIMRLGWILGRLWSALSQTIQWGLLIAAASLLALTQIPAARPDDAPPASPDPRRSDALAEWAHMLARARTSATDQARMIERLRPIAEEVVRYRYHLSAQDLRRQITAGGVRLDPALQAVLMPRRDRAGGMSARGGRAARWLPRSSTPPVIDLEAALSALEALLDQPEGDRV